MSADRLWAGRRAVCYARVRAPGGGIRGNLRGKGGKQTLFEIPRLSPQPPLWTPIDDEWLKVLRLPDSARRRPLADDGVQLPLLTETSYG